jgi:DnaJ-class molecular chaperone
VADSERGTPPDYYAILGVTREISPDGIRNAYRRMARRYHPDKNPNDTVAHGRFLEVREAYDVLRDPDVRRAYDAITDTAPPLSKHVRKNVRAAIRAFWRARYGLEDDSA